MSETAKILIDQYRSVFSLCLACLIYCRAYPKRERFGLHLVLGLTVLAGLTACWMPLYAALTVDFEGLFPAALLYLAVIQTYMPFLMHGLFEIAWPQIWFLCLFGKLTEVLYTILLRYLILGWMMPALEQENYPLYLVIAGLCLAAVYVPACMLTSREGTQGYTGREFRGNQLPALMAGYYAFVVVFSLLQSFRERLITPLTRTEGYQVLGRQVYLFTVTVMLVMTVFFMFILRMLYEIGVLEKERDISGQLLREKHRQYDFIRENTDRINERCHELRHEIRKLEKEGAPEIRGKLGEIREALNFYDAVVRTGDEVLDTILTEKSIVCANRRIKLSCMTGERRAPRIGTAQLYEILDGAIDEAIRFESGIENPDHRLISILITGKGEMMSILIENYLEGEEKNARLPKKVLHRLTGIVHAAGGEIIDDSEQNIHRLQILLPAEDAA